MTFSNRSYLRNFGLSVWLPFTVALAACQGAPPEVRPIAQTLVVSRWDHRANDTLAVGLDVDGVTSDGEGGCADTWDFPHVTAPREGVDNQYGGALLALLQLGEDVTPMTEQVTAELEAGRSLYGIRVEPSEDETVVVSLLSFTSSGTLPRSVAAQAEGMALTATPIASGIATPTPSGLRVAFHTTLGIPMGTMLGEREVEDVELELVVDDDGIVRHGDFGGAVTMATVMSVAEIISPVDVDPDDLAVLAGADLRPDESGGTCGAVSIGLGLDFVRVPE